MRRIIWEKIDPLHLLSEPLLPFDKMPHSWSKTANQSQDEGFNAVIQPHVFTAQSGNDRETTYRSGKRWSC